MTCIRILAVLAAAVLLAAPGALKAAPLEAYGKLPTIEAAAVSPNGQSVAIVVTNGEERLIVVQDVATEAISFRGYTGDHKVRSVQWAGDKHLLMVVSATTSSFDLLNSRREWYFANLIDLNTKRLKPLMRDAEGALPAIFDTPILRTYRGEPSVYVQGVKFVSGQGRLSLYRIDLDRGDSKLIETGLPNTIDWVVGSEGQPVAQETYDGRSGRWELKLKAGPGWREAVAATALHDRPYVVGLGRTGNSVLYAQQNAEKMYVWFETSGDGSPPQTLPVRDNQAPIRDPADGRMIGHYALVGDEDRYTFFDPQDEKVWKAVKAAFPGDRVQLESWSADRKKIVVLVDSPTEGPAYAVVDLNTRRATWLGAQFNDLKAADIGPKQAVRFKAADGLELTGYLTLPHGREAKNLPMVVFPHGGPAARDTPGFDWWAQGMASRGYAVLQVNFRGSDGLGGRLLQAGFGEWGRKMQTDLSDGVRHLAAQGTVDPKRVCIVGASYGGYAALAGATIDKGVYRCAVSVSGPSDLKKMVAWSRNRSGVQALRYWTRFMGAEDLGDPVLAKYSPALLAAQAEIPILMIHGRDDTVVPLEQSRIMAEALERAGKPAELLVQKGADHWLSRGDTRLETLTATVTFLEKHNPPN